MMKKLIGIILFSLLIFNLSGCESVNSNIAYTVYPIGYVLNRISGGRIDIQSIQDNQNVGHAQIVSNYKEILNDSGAFVYVGEIEPYLTVYMDTIESYDLNFIDLSTNNAFYKFGRMSLTTTDNVTSLIASPYYESEVFDLVDTTEMDLNIWLDPISMISLSKELTDYLSSVSTENKDYFSERYTSLEGDLILLDYEFESISKKLESGENELKFVSVTPSFGVWQQYGIQVYPLELSRYGVLPSEEQLAVIIQKIIDDKVRYIAYEPNLTEEERALFNRLVDELGLEVVQISNISSLGEEEVSVGADYITIMYQNIESLQSMITPVTETTPVSAEKAEESSEDNE